MGRIVEIFHPQFFLHGGDALFGERGHLLLFVDFVVRAGPQTAYQLRELPVIVAALLRLARYDQRCARLVDQDVVDLVHDCVVQLALGLALLVQHHVVAQIIESELVVGAVGDVRPVRLLPCDRAQVLETVVFGGELGVVKKAALVRVAGAVLDDRGRKPQQLVDRPHQLQADFGEIVVRRDKMRAAPGQRVQVERQRRHQCFAFAGLHLRDLARVEDAAADQLHVVVAQADGAAGRFAHRGERLRHHFVENLLLFVQKLLANSFHFDAGKTLLIGACHRRVLGFGAGQRIPQIRRFADDSLAELFCHLFEFVIGHPFEAVFQPVDLFNQRLKPLQLLLIWITDDFGQKFLQHIASLCLPAAGSEMQQRARSMGASRLPLHRTKYGEKRFSGVHARLSCLPLKHTDRSPGCTAYSTMHRETANVADPVLLPLSVEAPAAYAKNTTSVHGFSDLCYNVAVASG